MATMNTQAPAATIDTTASQPTAPDTQTTPSNESQGEQTQADKSAGQAKPQPKAIDTPENRDKLRQILKREKEDINVKFSNAELDLLDAHYAGKLAPSKKTKAQSAKIDETGISEPKGDEAPDTETETPTEAPEEETTEDESDTGDEVDPDQTALMKEVGAKSLKDALNKVKELRSKLGGKDAQAVSALQKQVQSEITLWQDVAKGVPAAIEHARRVYGINAGPINAQGSQQPQSQQPENRQQGGRQYIDENMFIDPESARIANEVLRSRDAEFDELKNQHREILSERDRNRKEAAYNTAKAKVIDEMVTVSQRIESLKGMPNLREEIETWYDGTKPNPKLDIFHEFFQIAGKEGTNLIAAATLKRGLEAERLIAEAEERGRKAAYGHKPNPSLSGSQGGRNEQGNYSPITDAQIEAMTEDHRLIPPDWFDAKDNLQKSKVPKRAWAAFGLA